MGEGGLRSKELEGGALKSWSLSESFRSMKLENLEIQKTIPTNLGITYPGSSNAAVTSCNLVPILTLTPILLRSLLSTFNDRHRNQACKSGHLLPSSTPSKP